jgi:hypothetical protein
MIRTLCILWLSLYLMPPTAEAQLNFQSISHPNSTRSTIVGVNNSNLAVGTATINGFSLDRAYSWQNGVFQDYAVTLASTTYTTNFNGISDGGVIVGQYDLTSSNRVGFLLQGNTRTDLPQYQSNLNTSPLDLNNAGQVVGVTSTTAANANDGSGFLYENGSFSEVYQHPGGVRTQFNSINNAGLIVGRWRDSNNITRGLIYQNGVGTSYEIQGNLNTHFFGVNDSNDIVGYVQNGSVTRGFLLKNATDPDPLNDNFFYLDYPGTNASGSRSYALNDQNFVVGTYNGFNQAYLVAVPEPSTLILAAGTMIAGMCTYRWRRKQRRTLRHSVSKV